MKPLRNQLGDNTLHFQGLQHLLLQVSEMDPLCVDKKRGVHE